MCLHFIDFKECKHMLCVVFAYMSDFYALLSWDL